MSAIKQVSSSLSPFQMECLGWINGIIAARSGFAWFKPSWVMATIRIESGWNPLVVNEPGRQDGLMQVIPSTVAEMVARYQLGAIRPQTDPQTSIETGMCFLDFGARELERKWMVHSIPLSADIEAYNEGIAAAAAGRMVTPYWLKWAFAQQGYAYLDGVPL